mmetsp:Transcript_63890/g.152376  ORF Transcript_63890/g.152376 Transcript_63890/m.152376 type:complete len:835 (-) Transcript_63890:237-2741(-)
MATALEGSQCDSAVVPLSIAFRLPHLAAQAKPWRSQLLEPILGSCSEERLLAPLGGPPRQNLRQVDTAVEDPDEATLLRLRRVPRHDVKEVHRPLQPRLAVRRLRLSREAKHGSLSSPSSSLRPPSPASVKESLYVRDFVGKNSLMRGAIVEEAEKYCSANREFAVHRMLCRREAEKIGRAQAAQWREESTREEGLYEVKWKLMNDAGFSQRPQDDEVQPKTEGSRPAEPAQSRASTPGESLTATQRPQFNTSGTRKQYRRTRASVAPDASAQGESVALTDETLQKVLPQNAGHLKSLPRPKKSLKARMRTLQQVARQRRRSARDLNSFAEGSRLSREDRSSIGLSIPPSPTTADKRASLVFGRPKHELLHRKTMMMDVLDEKVLPDAKERMDARAEKEKGSFQKVFNAHDRSGTGSVDQAELRQCLKELGLRGRTEEERVEIRQILWRVEQLQVPLEEFAGKIVPEVRNRLMELRRPALDEVFAEHCKDRSGMLSLNEALFALRCHPMLATEELVLDAFAETDQKMYESIRALSGTYLKDKHVLPLEHFCAVSCLVEERSERDGVELFKQLAIENGLDEKEQQAWKYALVRLRKAVDGNAIMDADEVIVSLRKLALVPHIKGIAATLPLTIRSEAGREGTVTFGALIRIVLKLWEAERQPMEDLFVRHDTAGKGALTVNEMQQALSDYGVVSRDDDEAAYILKCLEEFDEVGAKEVDRDEFTSCCHFIAWRLNWRRCEKERREAMLFGWTDEQYEDVRSAFLAIDEDMSDLLDREELVKALAMINPNTRMDTFSVFPAIGLNPAAEDLQIHLGEFLKLMMHLDLKEQSKNKSE